MGFADCDMNPANGCEANTNGDRTNCGGCGRTCAAGQVCSMGACVANCRAGLSDCNGSCRDLQNDPASCGMCGNACAPAPNSIPVCAAGSCRVLCTAGFGDCDNNPANGCETALDNANNCGSCGRRCAPANGAGSCNMGMCAVNSCNPGFGDCNGNPADGCEANLNNNPNNCGMCGTQCVAANGVASCTMGVCGLGSCNAGFGNCNMNPADGCEANLGSDPANCNVCGRVCNYANASATCGNGACAFGACNMGFADCDMNTANGCEVNTNTVANCGMCGRACSFANGVAACGAGSCTLASCNAGFANCDNNAANGCETATASDRNNCGACGTVCPVGQSCSGGACRSFPAACTTGGNPPLAGDNGTWVVCRADAMTAWIAATPGGSFSALAICQSFGYARVTRWGGTCGSVCGYCQGGTSCMNLGNQTFDSGGGDPRAGGRIGNTVHWECSQ
jgi:hypothetical protein